MRTSRSRWKRTACASSPSAATTAQTGVEMEALTAAVGRRAHRLRHDQSARQSIEIQDIYLLEKTGGKSGDFRRRDTPMTMTAAVLTISDGAHHGTRIDTSGPAVGARLEAAGFDHRGAARSCRTTGRNCRRNCAISRTAPGERGIVHDRRHGYRPARCHAGGDARRDRSGDPRFRRTDAGARPRILAFCAAFAGAGRRARQRPDRESAGIAARRGRVAGCYFGIGPARAGFAGWDEPGTMPMTKEA